MKTNEIANYIDDLQLDDADVAEVSLILNEYSKWNQKGLDVYIKIAEELEVEINPDSLIFNEIERFIVEKFMQMKYENY